MWAHGKFLTDAQAQGIIDKVDQKDDGLEVKHINQMVNSLYRHDS